MNDVSRRGFMAGTAGVVAAGVAAPRRARAAVSLPSPGQSGIDHIVVVMMENRSFDHYLGWLPGADGKQAGLTYTDTAGVAHDTHHLTTPSGCGFNDPDHSYEGGRTEFDNGACDGWLRAGTNDELSIGYFQAADLGFYGRAAREWTVCDRYFAAMMAPTVHDAIVTSPNWERTVLVVTYDEWGGFFDHVPPTVGPDPNPALGAGLRGFRVPCLVISPRAARGHVAHGLYDHTSVLKMIEWRHGLQPLTVRDAAANNLAEVLDFTNPPNLTAARYKVPLPITLGCLVPDHAHSGEDWPELKALAQARGFKTP